MTVAKCEGTMHTRRPRAPGLPSVCIQKNTEEIDLCFYNCYLLLLYTCVTCIHEYSHTYMTCTCHVCMYICYDYYAYIILNFKCISEWFYCHVEHCSYIILKFNLIIYILYCTSI